MKKVLVFGASGQLGQCLKKVCEERGVSGFIYPAETDANILDVEALTKLFDTYKPAYCINCAAYTAVDKAEDDVDMARKINKDGAANLAGMCKKHGTVLVHISTDFVFEGNTPGLLTEDAIAQPINVYGLTKLEGEQDIAAILPQHYIIRTSWLYSEYGNNFVKTMLKLGSEKNELKIIADQVGTPTYAIDLAGAIIAIVLSGKIDFGTYHYSNEGVTSWYDFAKAIFDISGNTINILPIRTSEYPTRAIRPAYSVMDKSKIKNTFSMAIPYWRDSLITCIKALK
jgi:dTDP-4-dehydrorhamnose reductase